MSATTVQGVAQKLAPGMASAAPHRQLAGAAPAGGGHTIAPLCLCPLPQVRVLANIAEWKQGRGKKAQ